MERLARPALLSILDAIKGIEASMTGKTLKDYSSDWLLKHGVERGIEIVSEATRRLPEPLLAARPEIPWKQIAAIGNVLRHNYDHIVDRVIYEAVIRDLPALKIAITAIEANLTESIEE